VSSKGGKVRVHERDKGEKKSTLDVNQILTVMPIDANMAISSTSEEVT